MCTCSNNSIQLTVDDDNQSFECKHAAPWKNAADYQPLTCEMKNLCPLLTYVHLDIRTTQGQIGATLIKYERLYLKSKTGHLRCTCVWFKKNRYSPHTQHNTRDLSVKCKFRLDDLQFQTAAMISVLAQGEQPKLRTRAMQALSRGYLIDHSCEKSPYNMSECHLLLSITSHRAVRKVTNLEVIVQLQSLKVLQLAKIPKFDRGVISSSSQVVAILRESNAGNRAWVSWEVCHIGPFLRKDTSDTTVRDHG